MRPRESDGALCSHATPTILADAHLEPIELRTRELDAQGDRERQGTPGITLRDEDHHRRGLGRGKGKPANQARPSPQIDPERSTERPHGVHDEHREGLGLGELDRDASEGLERRAHDEEPFEIDPSRLNPDGVQGARGIHESAPGHRSSLRDGWLLRRTACREGDGRGERSAGADGKFRDGPPEQPPIGQYRAESCKIQGKSRLDLEGLESPTAHTVMKLEEVQGLCHGH
jgi:hypothetical protein